MKKILFIFTALLLLLPFVLADGGIIIHDRDMWHMFTESQQYCAINYKDGFQNMIITVDTAEELRGDKAVWIFPVPADPEKTAINIIKGFPHLVGYDVEEKAEETVSQTFGAMRATQLYSFPLLFFGRVSTFGGGLLESSKGIDGVTVHERIEKMGLTTELVSTGSSGDLNYYLVQKGLQLPSDFKIILDAYIGQEYSFVISWISDIEKFNQEQGQTELFYGRGAGNTLGVFITFPTDKLYYPLKPTSVYGSARVPAVIYVMDYVEPELYSGIQADSEVNYFYQHQYHPQPELKEFFFSQDSISGLKYTKIKINPPSKLLTQDLWMERTAPARVKRADFMSRYSLLYGIIIFILSSCIASLIAGIVIFKDGITPKYEFALFGLFNFFTLIGFIIAAYFLKTKKDDEDFRHHKQGINLFENPVKKYYIVAGVFLALTVLWLFLGRMADNELAFLFGFGGITAILILIFKLSREHIKPEFNSFFTDRGIFYKIMDMKKMIYLFVFNLVLIITGVAVLSANYQLATRLSQFLSFGTYAAYDALIPLVFLVSFFLSAVILIFLDKLFRERYPMEGFYVMQKDRKKKWFVVVFSISFIVLTYIFQLLFMASV